STGVASVVVVVDDNVVVVVLLVVTGKVVVVLVAVPPRHVSVPGRISAAGPGRPAAVSSVVPVAALQKTDARVTGPVFGYPGPGQGGAGTPATPARTISPAPPGPVGKQGIVVSLEQHTWAMPPLRSTHSPSAVRVTQAGPVQLASQRPPWHASSCTGTPGGSPGCAW